MDPVLDETKTEDQLVDQILAETSREGTEANLDEQASNVSDDNKGNVPPVDDFKPESWQLNYRGQIVSPKDKQELINLAQQGFSYSQSMALLNQEKQRLQESMDQVKPYMELDKRFKEDPEFQNYLSNAIHEYQNKANAQGVPNADILNNPAIRELYAKVNEMESFKAQQEQTVADTDLQREIQELRASYPNEQWDTIDGDTTFMQNLLRHAYENNLPSLKTAYRDLAYDRSITNAKAEALKEAERKKTSNRSAAIVGGGTDTSSSGPKNMNYSSNDGENELLEKALAMLG